MLSFLEMKANVLSLLPFLKISGHRYEKSMGFMGLGLGYGLICVIKVG